MLRAWSVALCGLAIASTTTPAYANYFLGTVVNNTSNSVVVGSMVPAGSSITRDGLGRSGFLLAIGVPQSGVVRIYEDGTKCPGFTWAAKIEYAGQKWGFGYEGNGVINLTLNADDSLTVGGNGTVFPGGC